MDSDDGTLKTEKDSSELKKETEALGTMSTSVSSTSSTTLMSFQKESGISQQKFITEGAGGISTVAVTNTISMQESKSFSGLGASHGVKLGSASSLAKIPKAEEVGEPSKPAASKGRTSLSASIKIEPLPPSGKQPAAKSSVSQAQPPSSATVAQSPQSPAPTKSTVAAGGSETATLSVNNPQAGPAAAASPPSSPPPLKSLKMSHLRKKYTAQLQYMLREFRKLERQLLGAKGVEESAGSRERREKLHSFILHLEDTIRQIDLGCKLEGEGKSTAMVGVSTPSVGGSSGVAASVSSEEERQKKLADSALSKATKEKEEEENVQKLEEHILANLLPVKTRLTKQLAAQQGATRNPAGMPAPRGGMLQPSAAAGKGVGTFAAAAEQRRKEAEAIRMKEGPHTGLDSSTQFGQPLKGGGSSLTQKLHGSTLGSSARKHGHGVGSAIPRTATGDGVGSQSPSKKILYAGMAPGSKQIQSGVNAAADVHRMVFESPGLIPRPVADSVQSMSTSSTAKPISLPQQRAPVAPSAILKVGIPPVAAAPKSMAIPNSTLGAKPSKRQRDDFVITDEERKKLQKRRRRKQKRKEAKRLEMDRQRQMLLQQQAVQAAQLPSKGPLSVGAGKKGGKSITAKTFGKKRGPRKVEYICANCSEAYASTCDYNPWWALRSQDCPKCRKSQFPRIDITAPANAIEYHPALLAHAEDTSGGNSGGGSSSAPSNTSGGMGVIHAASHTGQGINLTPSLVASKTSRDASDSDSGSDFYDSETGNLSEDSEDSDDSSGAMRPRTPAEEAEKERFGTEYSGPVLTERDAKRLLVLLSHASTCPGRHKNAKCRDACRSAKFLMLHVRDCPGTTSTFDVCPFPWCRKVKHLLYHLVACPKPESCTICTTSGLSPSLRRLKGLNEFRSKKYRERMLSAVAAANAAKARARAMASRAAAPSAVNRTKLASQAGATSSQYRSWKPSVVVPALKKHASAQKPSIALPVKASAATTGTMPKVAAQPPLTEASSLPPKPTSSFPMSSNAVATAALLVQSTDSNLAASQLADPMKAQAVTAATGNTHSLASMANLRATATKLAEDPLPEASPSVSSVALDGSPPMIPATLPDASTSISTASLPEASSKKEESGALTACKLKESASSITAGDGSTELGVPKEVLAIKAEDQTVDAGASQVATETAKQGDAPVKTLPKTLTFPKLASSAALIEDHASTGPSEPETESYGGEATGKASNTTGTNGKIGEGDVKVKTEPRDESHGEANGSSTSTGRLPSNSPSQESKASCSEEVEKKSEPLRIGC